MAHACARQVDGQESDLLFLRNAIQSDAHHRRERSRLGVGSGSFRKFSKVSRPKSTSVATTTFRLWELAKPTPESRLMFPFLKRMMHIDIYPLWMAEGVESSRLDAVGADREQLQWYFTELELPARSRQTEHAHGGIPPDRAELTDSPM